MKILQVIPFFTPVRGGSVTATYYLSKELSRRDHEVTIITTDFEFDKEYAKSIEKEGVKVIPFHTITNIMLFLFSPNMKNWLKKEIINYDIVHLHNFRTYQNSIVQRFAKKHGIPYVLQPRGSIPRFDMKTSFKKMFDVFYGYQLIQDTAKLIFTTEMEVKKCGEEFDIDENKIVVVPNGIDLSEYCNLPKKGGFRKEYSIKTDEKIILYLGRIHSIKGIDLFVEAFSDLNKKMDNVKLVIAGPDDGYTSDLKEIISDISSIDKILFTGPLFGMKKLECYVDADVFVLPSKYESFGNVALEACACGTPLVITNRCGIADFVDKVAYVVEYDKNQLQDAVTQILSDEELQKRYGELGRQLVRAEFGWDKIVQKIERIYGDCAKK